MRALIIYFLFTSYAFAICRGFQRAEELLDTRRFLSASNEHLLRNEERRRHRLPPESEEILQLNDINQARSFAHNFPAIRDLGFPPLSANTWTPHIKRAVGGSRAGGLKDGWKINHNGRYAVIRLDFDPQKGMHYNIELEDSARRTHKLAIEFNCNNRPCTEADYMRTMATLNR